MAGSDARILIGRGPEMARLRAALEVARLGRPRVVIVAGEAGIGKSSLVDAISTQAVAEGWLRIGGTCLELLGGQIAYLPFVEALRSLVAQVPPDRVRPIIWPAREVVGRLLPELAVDVASDGRNDDRDGGDRAGQEGGELDRARLFESLLTVAERLAGAQPLLVVIEDVQWADDGTLDLVRFFVHGVTSGPVMLVMTLRTDGPSNRAGIVRVLAELDRSESVERIELGPFGRAEVAAQLEAIGGQPRDPDAVAAIVRRSGGNPFLVEELARADPTLIGDASPLPAGLRDLLLARVSELGGPAQEVVRVASAAGRVVDDDLLARVVALPERDVVQGLREAIDRGILMRIRAPGVEGYGFRHPLLREVVAARLLPIEARRLHAAYAEALTAVGARPSSAAEVAFHWDAAGEVGRALEASVEAAADAESVYAFAEAGSHYERALRLWSQAAYADDRLPLSRLEIIDRAAAMAALMGDPQRAIALAREGLAAIDPTADPQRAARFHSSLRWYLWDAGEHEAALRDALEAVRLMPAEPPTTELANVQAHAAGLLLFAGRLADAEAQATRALETARAVSAQAEEAVALGVLGWVEVVRGEADRGVELVREAWRMARTLGHVTGLAVAYNHLSAVLDIAGRVRESLDVAREGIAEAERLGTARSFGALLEGNAAHALSRLGRWDEAEAMTDAALARGVAAGPLAWLRIVRARLDVARGRFDAAAGELRALDAAADPTAVAPYVGWWYAARAEAATWGGEPAVGLDLVRQAFDDPRLPDVDASIGTLAALGLGAAAELVEAEPAGSTRSEAAREAGRHIRERMARLRRAGLVSPPDLPTAGPAGRSGGTTAKVALVEAEAARLSGHHVASHWRRLVAAAEVEERTPLVAYGRFRLAAALLAAQGDREQAASALRAAHTAAVELGALPLVAAIETLARRARIAVATASEPGADRGQPFGLTEREREVLALVVAGRSNREIGEALFISPKTASVHVSNILAKMEVDGRVEAATLALRLGMVPPHAGTAAGARDS